MPNKFLILTLFPDMFPGSLGQSLAGKALESGLWSYDTLQIRDFATDKHQTVDDTPYGGGAGMVLKPDVIDAAIREARRRMPDAKLVYLTPRGQPLTQALANSLGSLVDSQPDRPQTTDHKPLSLILLCGRYEAIDERVIEAHKPLEISIGDYILSGGEMGAMVLMDVLIRLLPGVMGADDSADEESFRIGEDGACLLEYPHYTRPPLWNGSPVPEALLSGNHAGIKAWRKSQAEQITKSRRPDLWEKYKKA